MTDRLEMSPEKMIEALKNEVWLRDTEISRLDKEVETLRAAILKVTEALNQGRIVQLPGISGMTIDAQLRNSVYNGVPAGLIEDARELVEEINHRNLTGRY